VRVPASEIIHDRMNCLFHPLVGISPLFAAGTSANIGIKIQGNSATFFANGSNPGGVLTAPGAITQETADRIKAAWDGKYTGVNVGNVAVLGDGLKYEPMRMSAVDSQLIETLKWSDEKICSVFHVPAYKVGVGSAPTYNNVEALQQDYYNTCLQTLIEEFEACMDEGLGLLGSQMGIEIDLDGLLRMDSSAQIDVLTKAVSGSILTIDEARAKMDRQGVKGGSTIWMQQQNYSLEALMERDANDPFAKPAPAPPVAPAAPAAKPEEDKAAAFAEALTKCFAMAGK
jgi:HK97 family phage portal protein